MAYKLVIVESPTKAKTISKFLGKGYKVESSFGHIRDLPKSTLGVDVDNDFEPTYEIPKDSKKRVAELKKKAKAADEIILATDEDREGEAIAWHLISALGIKDKPISRIVFHEITKSAIEEALKNPRKVNQNLVDAQQARRVLDRLVGYKLSPLLWKKIRRGLSAGRVQSVTVRMIVEREEEIRKFKAQEYWTIEADLLIDKDADILEAKLTKLDDKKLGKFDIADEKQAKEIAKKIEGNDFVITDIAQKTKKRKPYPPFKTSTLQQSASNRLGYSAKQTMRIAQQLYEGIDIGAEGHTGLITYMRTDSLNLSKNSLEIAREYIKESFGEKYLPAKPNVYKTKSKGAQEAHEAIRPSDPKRSPEDVKKYLDDKQYKIYKLIWERMTASQMTESEMQSTTLSLTAGPGLFSATGSIITFDGFLKVYPTKTEETFLPPVKKGQKLDLKELKQEQHFTQPPARYSEASLVKALEEHEIGRPSTYAPTISTIQTRGYVEKNEDKRFVPTDIGELVNSVLVEHFNNIVDINFTAAMEEDLDKIAHGKKEWIPIIRDFYKPFEKNLKKKEKELDKKKLTEEATEEVCDKCESPMIIKMGRFGKFLACSKYPDCKNTKQIDKDGKPEEPEKTDEICEECKSPMVVKHGRYGKFLSCSKYPDCKYNKAIQKGTGVHCPNCEEGEIIERKSKRGRTFYGCNQYPKCKTAFWSKPTGEKCPDCSSLLVYGAKNTVRCSSKECKYKKDADD